MGATSIFATLAFIFSAGAYVPYVWSVLTSKSKPTVSSWISWGLMDAAILAGMIAAHTIAWQMVAYVVGVSCVLIVCVYKGAVLGWTRFDTICLGIVVIAILLWGVSGDPNVEIVLSLVAILVGTIPFIYNIWKDPSREPMLPWVLITTGGVFGVIAIQQWSIAGAATPIVFLLVQIFAVWLISYKFRT